MLEARLEIEQLSQAGVEIDCARLPLAPIVARFPDTFQFDPLRTFSCGALAFTIPVNRVGQIVAGGEMRLLENATVTERAEVRRQEDELARLRALYPRN